MRLVAEAMTKRDLGQRSRADQHDLPRRLDSPTRHIRKRRHTKGLLEGMREMTDAEVAGGCQLRRTDGAFQMLVDEMIHALNLPPHQATAPACALG